MTFDDVKTTSTPTPVKWLHSGPRSPAEWSLHSKARKSKNCDAGGVPTSSSLMIKSYKGGGQIQSSN